MPWQLRKKIGVCIFFSLGITLISSAAQARDESPRKQISKKSPIKKAQIAKPRKTTPFRGWDELVDRLRRDGVPEVVLTKVYKSIKMPEFHQVPFGLQPKETHSMYAKFLEDKQINQLRGCISKYELIWPGVEKQYGISRQYVAALLFVETHFGQNLGQELVINRLSRVANIGTAENLQFNFKRHYLMDKTVTFEQVRRRARYLENTFYPEVQALFDMLREENVNLLSLKGSTAGAFGIPQFLPTSFLNFAVDGDSDGHVSLFNFSDAIASTAHFLSSYGWRDDLDREEKMKILWQYNRSEAYGNTILQLAELVS